jgi:hypothetical protein
VLTDLCQQNLGFTALSYNFLLCDDKNTSIFQTMVIGHLTNTILPTFIKIPVRAHNVPFQAFESYSVS